MWAVVGYLALAIPMRVATPSPGERALWPQVILALTASGLWVQLTAPRA